jgi:transposase-like protein
MRNPYSDETKAAVMAALLTGQSISGVAREYKIPKGTVGYWKSQRVDSPKLSDPKRERMGQLIIEYVEAALLALKAQAGVFANEKYITKQSASEAAVLHGVLADKAIRILEGIATSNEREGDTDV